MGGSRRDSRHMAGGSAKPMGSNSNHMSAVAVRLHLRYLAMTCERHGSPHSSALFLGTSIIVGRTGFQRVW